MRPALSLGLAVLLLSAAAARSRAEPFHAGQTLDQEQVARIAGSALAFMAPRILQPVPISQLTLWGLRGLTTLDPRLTVQPQADRLRLWLAATDGDRLLLAGRPPPEQDPQAWAETASAMIRAGWDASQAVRNVGTGGVIRTFFDELFNHLDPYSRYVPPEEANEEQEASWASDSEQTVSARRIGSLLVIRITEFARDTGRLLERALDLGFRQRARAVVLDLRGNRGGLLAQASEAAGTLLNGGIVATTSGRDPLATRQFRAENRDHALGLPVIVLVDGRTASAAEVLAAGLADQHRAVVVGSATLGKGLVQTIDPLPNGGVLFISWSRVLAPLGWPIQGLGVLPQVCTSRGETELAAQLAALAVGVQPMQAALARHRAARPLLPPAEALEIRAACPAGEGRDLDLKAARSLADHPAACRSALLGPPASAP